MGVRQLDLEAYETPEEFFAEFDHEVGRRVTLRIMPHDFYVAPDQVVVHFDSVAGEGR